LGRKHNSSGGATTAVKSAEAAREISLGSKKRSPDSHQDIGHQEIRILEVMSIRTSIVVISQQDLNRSLGIHVSVDPKGSEIEASGVSKVRTSCTLK